MPASSSSRPSRIAATDCCMAALSAAWVALLSDSEPFASLARPSPICWLASASISARFSGGREGSVISEG